MKLTAALFKWSMRIMVTVLVIVVTIILVRAFDSLRLAELSHWHRPLGNSEFSAGARKSFDTLQDYLKLEDRIFTELAQDIYQYPQNQAVIPLNRFIKGSSVDPHGFKKNWNRSFELVPDQIRGGVLMIHGLTDSPYSMRHIAELYYSKGFYVLALRMPGHGTVPGELIDATWQDWSAVTIMGARHVQSKLMSKEPLHIVGYSNGGALAVKYTLDSIEDQALPRPDRLVLMSPMLGVTLFSRFSDWHKLLSWIPFFEKFKWLDVFPEYDPYKYNSFPKAAGKQTFLLTREVNTQLIRVADSGMMTYFPPTLTFQSLVDATVQTSAIVDRLYSRMVSDNSELILFDVNRLSAIDEFLRTSHNDLIQRITEAQDISYTLTVVTNIEEASPEVVTITRKPTSNKLEERVLGLAWPNKIYSLSHVAIPFPIEDELYGAHQVKPSSGSINLGSLSPRGERDILTVPINMFMRLRYNPFYSYMEERITRTIEH